MSVIKDLIKQGLKIYIQKARYNIWKIYITIIITFTHWLNKSFPIAEQERSFLVLTRSLSYSASGDGDGAGAASESNESGSVSTSALGWGSESRSGWEDSCMLEVDFAFGTTSCFKMEAMLRIALTLKKIQPSDSSDNFLYLWTCTSLLCL